MSFTVEDVDAAIRSTSPDGEDWGLLETTMYNEVWNKLEGCHAETFDIPGIGTATVLEVKTGRGYGEIDNLDDFGDGYTDAVWRNWVIFELNGRYFRINGKYDSWDGEGPMDIEEVEKVTKTIDVWEKKLEY